MSALGFGIGGVVVGGGIGALVAKNHRVVGGVVGAIIGGGLFGIAGYFISKPATPALTYTAGGSPYSASSYLLNGKPVPLTDNGGGYTMAGALQQYLNDIKIGRGLSSGTYAGNASDIKNVYGDYLAWGAWTPPLPNPSNPPAGQTTAGASAPPAGQTTAGASASSPWGVLLGALVGTAVAPGAGTAAGAAAGSKI